MKLISNNFYDGGKLPKRQVFNGMGYNGNNLSPHLKWFDVPNTTKSFVLTCYDPDAPTGSGWWHWIVINLPANIRELPEGAGSIESKYLPTTAIQMRTDFGSVGYGGAAPPKNESHHYIFTIYAIDIETLKIDSNSSGAMVGFNIHNHSLESASITAIYF